MYVSPQLSPFLLSPYGHAFSLPNRLSALSRKPVSISIFSPKRNLTLGSQEAKALYMKCLRILTLWVVYLLSPVHVQAQFHTSNNDYTDYWMGPICSVQKTRGWYKENFGKIHLVNIDELQILVFDEKGRIILDRYISSKKMYSTVFIYDNTSSEKSMREISLSLDIKQAVPQGLHSAIKNLETLDFEEYLKHNGTKSELTHKYN